MKDSVIKEANETYDKIESILKGRIYPSWEEIRNKHGEDIQAARDEYNNHEIVKDFNKEIEYIIKRHSFKTRQSNLFGKTNN